MSKALHTYHPKPCANCDHRDMHGEVAGCIAVTSTNPDTWCDCEEYVSPRDRAADQREARAAGTAGADAALHGYSVTHDPSDWRAKAEARLNDLLSGTEPFTAEDVTDVVGAAPSPNAIGALFKGRDFLDRAEPDGFTTATRPEAKGRALRRWKPKAAA